MSTLIDGWVEIHHEASEQWLPVIDVGHLVGCCYDAYASLFGVRNYGGWEPVAVGRSLPSDASYRVTADYTPGYHHDPSWITWQELHAVDWRERSRVAEVHEWGRTPNGVPWLGKGYCSARAPADAVEFTPGEYTWSSDGVEYTLRTMTRAEAVEEEQWQLPFTLMAALAGRYSPAYVRLVVWFVT